MAGLWLALAVVGCDELMTKRTTGERLFRKHCSDCHGIDGGGQTVRFMGNSYANLRDDMWKHGGSAESMEHALREGVVFRHPSFDNLSNEELRQIVRHVLKLRGEHAR